jgi:hypothetical protein
MTAATPSSSTDRGQASTQGSAGRTRAVAGAVCAAELVDEPLKAAGGGQMHTVCRVRGNNCQQDCWTSPAHKQCQLQGGCCNLRRCSQYHRGSFSLGAV